MAHRFILFMYANICVHTCVYVCIGTHTPPGDAKILRAFVVLTTD